MALSLDAVVATAPALPEPGEVFPRGAAQTGDAPVPAPAPAEGLYLIGRPTLKQFLRHVRSHAVNPPGEGTLVDEWHEANRVVRALEREEAGIADDAHPAELGAEYRPLLGELLADPLIRHGFNTVPTDIALIDLNRVVVYQKHIDLTYVHTLERSLPRTLTHEEIFRLCLPSERTFPPVKWSRVHHDKFVFVSPSNDLRFLGIMPLESDDVPYYPPPGNVVGIVGIAVGFGSNFLNALAVEGRLVLRNGSHRAYLLRKLGITHVPCIVQHVSSRAALEVVGSSEIQRHPDHFLKHPRPSMLSDYFNPALRKVMPVHRRLHQVTVGFHVEENVLPAL